MYIENDPMGTAIADYHAGKESGLAVLSPMFDEDEIPVSYLFRNYDGMSALEQRAIDLARGRILDVGAGAGCHSLSLQARGLDVTSIDISPLAVETMTARGVKNALCKDFFSGFTSKYDTILMLMNGIGIVGRLDRLPSFFAHVDSLLAPGGQVLFDSSDLSYVYEDEDGMIDLTGVKGYYGEIVYKMKCRDVEGDYFPWLYVDFPTLSYYAESSGYDAELILEGTHYDYLARLTKKNAGI